jgi:hypothetical protein
LLSGLLFSPHRLFLLHCSIVRTPLFPSDSNYSASSFAVLCRAAARRCACIFVDIYKLPRPFCCIAARTFAGRCHLRACCFTAGRVLAWFMPTRINPTTLFFNLARQDVAGVQKPRYIGAK